MKKNIIKFLLLSSTIFTITGCDKTTSTNTTSAAVSTVTTTEIFVTEAVPTEETTTTMEVSTEISTEASTTATTENSTTVAPTTEVPTTIPATTPVPTTAAPTQAPTTKAYSEAYNAIPAEYRKIASTNWGADHENKLSITLDDDGIFHIAITSSYPDLGYDWSTSGTATWSSEYQGLYCTDYTERSYDYKTKQTDVIAENGTAELYLVDGILTISVHHGHIMTSSYMFYPQ